MDLNTDLIYSAVYELIKRANVILPKCVYEKLKNDDEIMQNAYWAYKNNRPLCQDTGQVVIFLEIGQDVVLKGEWVVDSINRAVSDCYRENFYRKSTVKDSFDRENLGSNTPAIIHTSIIKGDEVNILLGIKGGGAENMSKVKMFNPTASKEEILDFARQTALDAGESACPPMMLGIGVGATIEGASILAKKALYRGEIQDIEIENVFETRLISAPTHIASMPVCVNINCHSSRHSECKIKNGEIIFEENDYEIKEVQPKGDLKEIGIDGIKNVQMGEKVLFSGTIYTARDQAHKKMVEEGAPIELKDAIIFYAGPCPSANGEVIGPIGPTTSKRMDKFAPILFEKGVLASIGKGDRTIKDGIYFKAKGGVASLLQKCVKKAELVAYPELGAEAIYKLEVEKFPITRAL